MSTLLPRRLRAIALSAVTSAAVTSAAVTSAAVTAQDPVTASPQSSATTEWRAPDGSRFLLVPDRSTAAAPVVHWVVAVPTQLDDDPPGALGLSRAVLRASLDGTWRYGSTDIAGEAKALDTLSALRAALQQADGDARARLLAEVEAARTEAAALADPTAWRRTLARAPAEGPRLHELVGGSLLQIATTVEGLPQVAVLLREWREHAALRGVHEHLLELRSQAAAVTGDATALLLAEVLGTSFRGSAAARAFDSTEAFVTRADALRQWQRTIHPSRTLHVLSGGFDPAEVRALLAAVFETTALPPAPAATALRPAGAGSRRSDVPSPGVSGIALAWSVPATASPFAVQALAEWLLDGDDGFVTRRLKRLGRVHVERRVPFPANAVTPLLVVLVTDPSGKLPSATLEQALRERIDVARTPGEHPPEVEQDVARAIERIAARQPTGAAEPAEIAISFARECGLHGRSPSAVAAGTATPDSRSVLRLAEEILGAGPRTAVALSPSR